MTFVDFIKKSSGFKFSVNALLHIIACSGAVCLIWLLATRRFLDFSDEGFYLTSAWLAYSEGGQLPVSNLMINFGLVLGLPYIVMDRPPIVLFRTLSMAIWYITHLIYFIGMARVLGAKTRVFVPHLLAMTSLFVFLIPMLSYQNLPYMFCMQSVSILLFSSLASSAVRRDALLICSSIPLGLALVSSSSIWLPFSIIILYFLFLMPRCSHVRGQVALSLVLAIAIGVSVFKLTNIIHAAEYLSFFNSEVTYTSGGRLFDKVEQIFTTIWSSIAIGVSAAVLMVILRRKSSILPLQIGTVIWLLYVIWQASMLRPMECQATCDDLVILLIKSSIVACAICCEELLFGRINGQSISIIVLALLALQLFLSIISNAPLQYNLKYCCPSIFGIFILLHASAKNKRRARFAWTALVLIFVCLPAAWVTARSNYGRGDVSKANVALDEFEDFRFMMADAARFSLLRRLYDAYSSENCSGRYFAAVDSLMLGYFIFKRRPPFPHAWVATRVASSRDLIDEHSDGCVLMQDRFLPGTPPGSETMHGYLRLTILDRFSTINLGENFYLISYHRHEVGP